MNKQEQRTFGITENLLNKPVPRFYGAGDHKVQLAYITPDEADLLSALDLHGSNPPNPGPEGIPNFNDPGTGMSGAAASASEAGPNAGKAGQAEAAAQGVSIGSSPVGPSGDVDYGGASTAPGIGPSPDLGNVSESGFNNDTNNPANKDKKSFRQALKDYFSQKMSFAGLLGTAIGYGLFGPIGGVIGGQIGGTYGDDDPSNNFGGMMMDAMKTDFTNTMDAIKDPKSIDFGVGSLFGPAPGMEPDRGGNRPPIDSSGLINTLPEEIPPIEQTPIETMTFTPNYGGSFQFDPTTNSFGFRP